MQSATSFLVVYVTTNSFDNARNISRILVSEKLAACCTIIHNVLSIYHWQGTIDESMEYLLMIKTSTEKRDLIEQRISEIHPYDVPEIIALNMNSVSAPYMAWLKQVME